MQVEVSTAIIGAAIGVLGLIGSILYAAFNIGRAYGAIESTKKELAAAVADLHAVSATVAKVPVVEASVRQVEEVVRKAVDDIRQLYIRVAGLEGENRVRERYASRPNLDGE